ncbi:MAG TPA: DUF2203 family protein [Thermoanaerobaculia bacterium]|nr:DUF2203 family protein [Thermoanaerobaculia bacterium]
MTDSPTKRTFTYEQAQAQLPHVQELTAAAVRQIESLFNRVQSRDEMETRREELEAASQAVVEQWARQVTGLGCEVKGLWLVDWDSGAGYYCWRYPEETLGHFHGYDEGFPGRVPIQ